MAFNQAMSGLGDGMMRGLELHRRHRFEDEDAARRAELHDLRTTEARQRIDHNDAYMPMQRNTAALNLERVGRNNDIEAEAYRISQLTDNAVRGFLGGDYNALNEWSMEVNHGNGPIFMPGQQPGSLIIETPDGQQQEMASREVLRFMHQMTNPQAVLDAAMQPPPEEQWHRLNDHTLFERGSGRTMGLDGDGGPAGREIPTADYNAARQAIDRFWGTLNADGQFLISPDAREHHATAWHRAGEMMRAGVPVTEATKIANFSLSGPLDEAAAMREAEKEAREQGLSRRDRREYVRQRTPEIMEESRAAEREYDAIVSGAGRPQAAAGGARATSRAALPVGPGRPAEPPMYQQGMEAAAPPRQALMENAARDLPVGWSVMRPEEREQEIAPRRTLEGSALALPERDSPGARLRRQANSVANAAGEIVTERSSQAYDALGRELVRPALTSTRATYQFVRDVINPGIDPRAVPVEVREFERYAQQGETPPREVLERTIDFVLQNPAAMTGEAKRILREMAASEDIH